MAKLSEAPGCFGAPLVRAQDHPLCKTCEWRTACAKFAKVNDERMQKQLGVESPVERLKQRRRSSAAAAPTGGLTKKATELVATLAKQGVDRASIETWIGQPQTMTKITPRYAGLAIKTIGSRPHIHRNELIRAFVREYEWGQQTALSHAAIITSALSHYGVIEVRGDTIHNRRYAA